MHEFRKQTSTSQGLASFIPQEVAYSSPSTSNFTSNKGITTTSSWKLLVTRASLRRELEADYTLRFWHGPRWAPCAGQQLRVQPTADGESTGLCGAIERWPFGGRQRLSPLERGPRGRARRRRQARLKWTTFVDRPSRILVKTEFLQDFPDIFPNFKLVLYRPVHGWS